MQKGLHYHQSANFEQAQICYQKSLQVQANNYETLQLFGALMHKLGNSQQAIVYLNESLSISPKQAHVLNTLGNVYKAAGQTAMAIEKYQMSLRIKHDYIDPYLNLCNLLLQQERFEEVQALLIKDEPTFAKHWQFKRLKALLAKSKKNYPEAIELLLQANQLSPNHTSVLHDLGLVYRLNGQSALALEYYQEVEQLGHRSQAFFHNYANALSDLSASSNALDYYSRALSIDIFARDTLLNWCNLMWENGQAEHMFSAYEKAISHEEAPVEIYIDYIHKLLRLKQVQAAQGLLQKMQTIYPQSSYVQLAIIAIKRNLKDYEFDELLLNVLFSHNDLDLVYKLDVIEYVLEAGKIEYAYAQLMKLRQEHANDQLLLGLLQTCSRLLPDREYPFENVEQYLFEYEIAPPEGTTLDAYLADLKDFLLALHSSKEQPLEQTLHKGTQTRGNLFDLNHPLLAHIQSQYKIAVNAYTEILGHLPPLYPNFWQNKATEFSGSWSVALKQNGFHNHHVHPMGWLSSACYIALPIISDNDNQGYFQIGVPNLANNGLGLPPLKEIKPKLGMLMLFPSMLWHGTVPFEENSLRLSIACDIVYANENLMLDTLS